MQKTRALGSLRTLFPPIHQPLPLDKREAQRLLDGIKASFRAQLDAEYGFDPPPSNKPSSSANPASASSRAAAAAASRKHAAAPSTDRHMRAIIKNPLFLPTDLSGAPKGRISPLDAHKAIFEKAVSRGLMTVPRAHGFLMLILSEVNKAREETTKVPFADDLGLVGAGKLVAQWLRSSGQEHDLAFLANEPFRRRLLQFMVAEGLDEVVWTWVERAVNAAEQQTPSAARRILKDFIDRKAQAHDLEPAYTALLRAEAMVREKKLPLALLREAWLGLATHTAMYSDLHSCPPVQLFDAFIDLGRAVGSKGLRLAHVTLHHPVNPSPDLALKVLSGENREKLSADRFRQVHLKRLGIDTVRHLIETNQRQEASRLWDMLRQYFPTGLHAAPDPLSGMGASV